MMSTWRSSFFTSKRPLLFQDPLPNKTPRGGHPKCLQEWRSAGGTGGTEMSES